MRALEIMEMLGLQVEGIIHVGANYGQERDEYAKSGANPCIYVEPIDPIFQSLQKYVAEMPGHMAVQAVCSDADGAEVVFNISNNDGMSSSFLGLGLHGDLHPNVTYVGKQVMKTVTLDRLVAGLNLETNPNLLVIDTQGTELKVLRGAKNFLHDVSGIFVEISETPLYEGGCTHEEITSFLKPFNFRMKWMELTALGYGDAFYARGLDEGASLPRYSGNLALHKPAEQSSISDWSGQNDAAGGNNGKKTGSFGFHTDLEKRPWWQVDLGSETPVSEVRIYNRLHSRKRARSLKVYFSSDKLNWSEVHDQRNRLFGGVDGRPLRIMCNGRSTRYVRVQLNEENYLHLDEIEVY